jgi:hypothetical protein
MYDWTFAETLFDLETFRALFEERERETVLSDQIFHFFSIETVLSASMRMLEEQLRMNLSQRDEGIERENKFVKLLNWIIPGKRESEIVKGRERETDREREREKVSIACAISQISLLDNEEKNKQRELLSQDLSEMFTFYLSHPIVFQTVKEFVRESWTTLGLQVTQVELLFAL